MMNYPDLEKSLLATLTFFDVFDYPLTLLELRRWRFAPNETELPALADYLAALVRLPVEQRDGYWCLRGRVAIVERRHERYRSADGKFRRARRLTAWLRQLPWVRLVAVCNSLAWSNAGPDSDIDLLLICRPRTLWLTRLLVVGSLSLLGLRPNHAGGADRFCLSFFVADNALDLAELRLPGGDPYFACWLASLVPLYDAGRSYERLLAANGWLRQELPGTVARQYGRRRTVVVRPVVSSAPVAAAVARLDRLAASWQRRHFPAEITAIMNRDSRVVVSDELLKFHVGDRREHYRQLWEARCAALGL